MMLVLIIIAVVIFLFIGYALLDLGGFLKEESVLAKLSYSWGLGVGIIGMQLFLYAIGHVSWSLESILLPWLILFAIFFYKKRSLRISKIKLKLSRLEIIFAVLILLLLFFTGFESILRPVHAWDGWDNWVFRPKVFYLQNNLSMDYVSYTHDDYPLIIPLMGTFGYFMMGGINDRYVLLLFFMFYLALGGMFFSFCKKELGTKKALIMTFLLLSLQNLIRHGGRYEVGQADLALGYYFFTCTTLLLDFLKTKNNKTLLLVSIFLGFTAQIKNDGIPFFIIVNGILIVTLILQRRYRNLFYVVPSFAILLPWELYKKFNNYPQDFLFTNGIHPHTDKILAIFLAMSKEFFNFQNWNILWIVFFATLIICWKQLNKIKVVLLLLAVQWLSYYTVFMFTPREPIGHVENVIDKLYIHLAPLALLIIGIVITPQLKLLKKNSWKRYFD